METKNYFSTDAAGNIIPGAQVYVNLPGTSSPAPGITNINGAPLANPFTAASSGLVQFKAPDGEYDLRVVGGGREFTIRIQCFDGVAFSASLPEMFTASNITGDGTNLGEQLLKSRKLANYTALRAYSGSATNFEITDSLLHGFFYFDADDTTSADNGGTTLIDGNGRRIKRQIEGSIKALWFGLKVGSVSDAQALTNSEAINAALDFAGASTGGAIVELPTGTIWLDNTNPSAGSWDNKRAIYLRYSGLTLQGQGIGRTILKPITGANCTIVKLGAYAEYQVVVTNCIVRDLEIDGNRANQITPTETQEHHSGIAVSNGCAHTTIERVYTHDNPYYGVGMGQEGLFFCRVYDVEINNTGADGLDWKNNANDQLGGWIDGLVVSNHGLLPMSNVLTAQTGLDLRSGVHATNITINPSSGESGLIGIRLQTGTSASAALRPSRVDNFRITGSLKANSVGLRLIGRGVTAGDGKVSGYSDGVSVSGTDCRVDNVVSEGGATGFRFWTSSTDSANTGKHSGLVSRSNTQAGVIIDGVAENTFLGCDVRNNAIGYDVRSGSASNRIIGGSISGNTASLSDLGTGTVLSAVSGLRTSQKVTVNVPLDGSTGVKNLVFNHTLGVTPEITDVQLTLNRDPSFSSVGDFTLGFFWVTGTTATTITAQYRLTLASATAGVVAKMTASINAKSTT